MADLTTIAAGAATGAAGSYAAGLPPKEAIICGLIGAIVSVWVTHGKDFAFTPKWFGMVLGLVALYFCFGIFGAAFVITVGPKYDLLKHVAAAPQWVLSGGLSLGAAFLLPLVGDWVRKKVGKNARS